jgi:hypothetical protein
MSRTDNLQYHFREVTDLAKYSFKHIIGLVRIDLMIDDSSISNSKYKYTNFYEQLSSLEEALKLTTPVARGSKTTFGESKKRKKEQAEERADYQEGLLMAKNDYRGGGGRGGLRGASGATAAKANDY